MDKGGFILTLRLLQSRDPCDGSRVREHANFASKAIFLILVPLQIFVVFGVRIDLFFGNGLLMIDGTSGNVQGTHILDVYV